MFAALILKGTAVLVAAFALTAVSKRASAATRHLIWICAFACLLILPLLQRAAPRWQVTVPESVAPIAQVIDSGTATPVVAAHRPFDFTMLWFVGIALAAIRLTIALVHLRKLASNARPLKWHASPAVTLLESDGIDIPITFGILRPRILFPAGAAHWPEERRSIVLAHELAHVKRSDCLTQLLAEAACAVYWFHPLAWIAAAECRKERERACDDAVLSQGTRSSDYAEHLLDVVRSVQRKGAPLPMSMSISSHDLEQRLKAVLKPHSNRRALTPKLVVAAVVLALCIVIPIATMRAQPPAGTGNLSGSVYDASGAVVPRVMVIVTGLDTHNKEVTRTGPDGLYSFTALPAGRYTIEVRAPGFTVFQQTQAIADGASIAVNPALELGGVSENVDVVGQKPSSSTTAATHRTPQRIRVGGMVQAVKLVYKVPPVYPEHAKQNGVQGSVVLQGVIGKDGNILSLQVISTTVDPELAQAARDAVSQWRYQPTLLNGEPVEVVTAITVTFRLE